MADFEIASTEVSRRLLAPDDPRSPTADGPSGILHAVDPENAAETACGIDTRSLRRWRLPWHAGDELQRCAACVATTVGHPSGNARTP